MFQRDGGHAVSVWRRNPHCLCSDAAICFGNVVCAVQNCLNAVGQGAGVIAVYMFVLQIAFCFFVDDVDEHTIADEAHFAIGRNFCQKISFPVDRSCFFCFCTCCQIANGKFAVDLYVVISEIAYISADDNQRASRDDFLRSIAPLISFTQSADGSAVLQECSAVPVW